jgi:hypothetical protein
MCEESACWSFVYSAEGPPAPVKKISKGELGGRMGPEMEAQRECVPMLTRPECSGELSQGLSDVLILMLEARC